MKRWFPYALIFLAIVGLTWQWQSDAPATQAKDSTQEFLDHRYQMHQVSMRQFDDSGNLIHRIDAQVATVGEQQTTIKQPRLISRSESANWSMSSKQAIATDSFTQLLLQGDVKVIEHSGATPLQIHTEQLQYFGEQRRLYSSLEVIIDDGEITLSGTGFEVDLTTQDYQILSDVKGTRRP